MLYELKSGKKEEFTLLSSWDFSSEFQSVKIVTMEVEGDLGAQTYVPLFVYE